MKLLLWTEGRAATWLLIKCAAVGGLCYVGRKVIVCKVLATCLMSEAGAHIRNLEADNMRPTFTTPPRFCLPGRESQAS
ncbi:hypothetical protein L207DRAFT_347336 [Hyaloscypha variabilis F]|jgi:hypothetical protein|uniref:Uncharacterized protein n=1 Tax=Hyaloscypha variabilis (strain UAMH 11265 / GT02V1 / F) TaxID=1149755 RepID=A0A2J6RQX9_HYAVF|nr:hypothetical protein L207DRAFT_347336 [Hyaloscypha variabilis F]